MRPGSVLVVLALVAPVFSGLAQQKPQMSAREVFYAAPKVEAKKRRPAPSVPGTDTAPKPPSSDSPVTVETAASQTPPAGGPVRHDPPPDNTEFVPAVHSDLPQFGLRCSVLKRVGPSDLIEVSPDMVFRSGERIRLRVEANDDGYLYVILRGSSGVWKPLFPSPEVDGGNNRIVGGRPYDIPPGYVFTFDEQAGEERLFVVLSRQPVEDLDGLIYKLGQDQPPTPAAPKAKPSSETKLLLAQNLINIEDSFVDRLRNAYARDLIIEKVDDSATDETYGAENAVYAVTGEASADSRVVVDLKLIHR